MMNTKSGTYQEAVSFFEKKDYESSKKILLGLKQSSLSNSTDITYFLAVIKSKLGEFADAAELFKKVIQIKTDHIEAYYNLALCLQNLKQNEEALKYYQKVLEINPFLSEAHNNMAVIYSLQNKLDKAEEHYNQAVKSKPNNYNASSNLANLSFEKVKSAELQKAIRHFENKEYDSAKQILFDLHDKNPKSIELLNALGTLFFHNNDIAEAINYFKKVIEIDESNAGAHYSLGVCYQNMDNNNTALKHYDKCIELNPDHIDGLNNLGLLHSALKNFDEAEKCFKRTIALKPDYFNGFTNLGSLKINQDKFEEAFECFNQALKISVAEKENANKSVAYANLGFIRLRQKRLDEAIEYFDTALKINPESVLAHYNKAETLFLAGRLEEGWKHYEYRTNRKDFGKRHFHKTPENLKELKNKKVLVYAEQGLGDAFQFIRYIPLLKEFGCYIIFECDKTIFGLLKNFNGIDELLERDLLNPPEINYDYEIPLLSLPMYLNTSLKNIPADVPYFFADEELKAKWGKIMGNNNEFKIGVVWAGSPIHSNDRHRSVKLAQFLHLLSIEGTRFYSLQKGFPLVQAKDYQLLITNLDDYGIQNFSDTAAILDNLDLLITVDTSVAHLAGAMGKPVWILLPNLPDWRWMLDGEKSPWYPSMKLYRQPALGDWGTVFTQLKKDLIQSVHEKRKTPMTNLKRSYVNYDNFLTRLESEAYAERISDSHKKITDEVLKHILKNHPIPEKAKILDIGCGQGPALSYLTNEGYDPIGITLNEDDLKICHSQGFNVLKMDQSFLDFESEHFDFLWARHVLEHSIAPLYTLSEYYRVSKAGALLYIEVPAPDTDAHHESNPNHYSVLSKSMWYSLINKAGFRLIDENLFNLEFAGGKDEYWGFLCQKLNNSSNKLVSQTLYLGLSSGENFGWGVCSKYLKKELSKKLNIINLDECPDIIKAGEVDAKVFHALGNDFSSLFNVKGKENYGYTFFEYELSDGAAENSKKYNLILGGSTWNKQKLIEKGISNSSVLIQGIDPTLFYPSEKEKNSNLFIIFSGGKFELRKGQDLVLKAVKILQQKYSDIILINAWYNLWPEVVNTMAASRHIQFENKGETWKNFMVNLCQINGIDGDKVFTLPITPNDKLREVYLNSDIGLFPNRCEGGTNLVLMEYMACGKPVIASYNTGHRDILTEENSIPLKIMHEFKLYDDNKKLLADWEEPEIDEIVAQLEYAYFHRDDIKKIGGKAAEDMKRFTWEASAESLLKSLVLR